MNLITKSFHVFLAVLIAVPLGAGGICCCLTDGLAQEFQAEQATAKAPASSCCSKGVPEAPARAPSPHSACPDDADGDDSCECPVRDTALLAATPSALVFVEAAPPVAAAPIAVTAPEPIIVPAPVVAPATPHPPPKIPLYLQHSVLRS